MTHIHSMVLVVVLFLLSYTKNLQVFQDYYLRVLHFCNNINRLVRIYHVYLLALFALLPHTDCGTNQKLYHQEIFEL